MVHDYWLEKRVPAQLNAPTRDRLLQEKFNAWLQEQIQNLPDRDKVWLGIVQNESIEITVV
jgi:hypothetical protein